MRYSIKENKGKFFKKGDEIRDGDILEIVDEGRQEEGQFGTQNIFLVKLSNEEEEGQVSFNQTTLNNLVEGYGNESRDWVGKKVKVFVIRQNVQGKIRSVFYFLHPDSVLDEASGDFLIGNKKDDNIPVIDTDMIDTDIDKVNKNISQDENN